MRKQKTPAIWEPTPIERSFVLRLPNHHAKFLDGLVDKGVAKSRNDLIVEIIDRFMSDLGKKAEEKMNGR